MSANSQDLQRRRRDLEDAQSEIDRALKQARQQQKNEQKGRANAWQLSSLLLHTALIIYSLSGYNAHPAAKYLLTSGRKRHWPQKSEEELEEMVEGLFMKCDVDELADFADTQNPKDMRAMRAALPYVEQWRLVTWTSQANVQQGVAPSTESVLQQYEAQRQQLPEAVRPPGVGVPAQTSARVWAAAWRRRWGGKHGRIRVREQIPVEELRSKALENWTTSSTKIGPGTPKCDPISGSQSAPVLGSEFELNSGMQPRSPIAGA